MSRFIKDKKIKIYSYQIESDEIANQKRKNFTLKWKPLWAYVRQASMDKVHKFAQVDLNVSWEFIINYHEGLDPSDVINYNGKWYEIKSIDRYEDNKRDITIYADTAPAGRKPEEKDIITE